MRHPYYAIGDSPEQHFCRDTAVINLIREGLLYIGLGPMSLATLFACADDIFHPGEDRLIIYFEDIQGLYDICAEHGKVGFVSWLARHKWQRPMESYVNKLAAAGLWDDKCEEYPTLPAPDVQIFPSNVSTPTT